MLSPDCLLKNTDYHKGVQKYMEYVGPMLEEGGKEPSFKNVYEHLRKEGLEVDVETAGYIYHEAFRNREGYTPHDEVAHQSGQEFEETVWNKMVNEPEADYSEKQIGNLSPTKEIVRRLSNLFEWGESEDHTTQSTLKSIQEAYHNVAKDLFKVENEGKNSTPENWTDTLERGLSKMKEGYSDTETGLINNLKTMHEAVNKEISKLTERLRENGEHQKADALEKAAKDLQSTEFAIALNSKEMKEVVNGSLQEAGYVKIAKSGEVVTDWEKLSGEKHSAQQLRETVIDVLKKKGVDDFVAGKVADQMQHQLQDAVKTMASIQASKYERDVRSNEKKTIKKDNSVDADTAIQEAVSRWNNFIQYEGQGKSPLVLSAKTAKDAMREILRSMGVIKNVGGKDFRQQDVLAQVASSPQRVTEFIKDYFSNQKNTDGTPVYTPETVDRIANAMQPLAEDVFDNLKEHVIGKQKQIEETWAPKNNQKEPEKSIPDLLDERLNDALNHAKITHSEPSILLKRSESKRIFGEAIKDSEAFGKEYADGSRAINWKELGLNKPDANEVRQMLSDFLKKQGIDEAKIPNTYKKVMESLEPLIAEFHRDITDHANSIVAAQEKALAREKPERNSALKRIADLHTLGAFDGAHDDLLKSVIGVSDITKDDLNDIDGILSAYDEAMKDLSSSNYSNNAHFFQGKVAQQINSIVGRNIHNRSALLKYLGYVQDHAHLQNLMLISGPYNLFENFISGQQGLIGANAELALKTGKTWEDKKLWWNTLLDETMGSTHGSTGDKFMGGTDVLSNFRTFDFKKHPFKAAVTTVATPLRFALNGMDAANKAVSTNKAFIYLAHEALMQKGYDEKSATSFLSEMLTGQKREETEKEARKFVDKHWQVMGLNNTEYSKSRAAVRLGDDFVKANIQNATSDPFGRPNPMTADIMEKVMNGAHHAAGIALGHEANNPFSRKIQAGRKAQQRIYDEAIKNGNMAKAAVHKVEQIVLYDMLGRLASGGVNWANLGFQYTGIPLLWDLPKLNRLRKEKWDFEDKEVLSEQMRQRIATQREVSRGIQGIATFAVLAGMAATYGALRNKDKNEDSNENVFTSAVKGIEKNQVVEKLINKTSGQLSLLAYDWLKFDGTDTKGALYAALEFMDNAANINSQYSPEYNFANTILQAKRGKDSKAWAGLGQTTGSYLWPGGVPFYRPYREFYKFVKDGYNGKREFPEKGEGFVEGLLYSGATEDFINTFINDDDLNPSLFPSWGVSHEHGNGAKGSGQWQSASGYQSVSK